MHIFNYESWAILPATVCYFITAEQTLALHFLVGWSYCFCGFIFIIMLRPKEIVIISNINNKHRIKSPFIPTFIYKLQNYTKHPFRSRCVKTHKQSKESDKCIYFKKLFLFLCIFYSMERKTGRAADKTQNTNRNSLLDTCLL